jgi:hypothetical protein
LDGVALFSSLGLRAEAVVPSITWVRVGRGTVQVQKCTLLSIKTGGCPEDCGYCSQSSKHSKDTGMKAEKLVDLDYVYHEALKARDGGSTRFCMGAAWRGPSQVYSPHRAGPWIGPQTSAAIHWQL